MTFWSFRSIKSRLVRKPRKVSSIMSFLFSRTTIAPLSEDLWPHKGNSPKIGTFVNCSTSPRFSILYFNNSTTKMIPTGINRPTTNAANKNTSFLGATGSFPGNGSSTIRPLLAVAANVIAFSSRFCNSMIYKVALISCWREIVMNSFSCFGASLIRLSNLLAWRSISFWAICSPRKTLFTVVSTLRLIASTPVFMFITAGLFSEEVRNKRLRSMIIVLYCSIILVRFWSCNPTFAGITSSLLTGSLI